MIDVAALNAALAGRYTVAREVGRGGVAVVFLAQDLRHNRQVALKVLRPELCDTVEVTRFLTEVRVTATLHHPNLLPLFDSGEAGGMLYYAMPYIGDETLRQRLRREGRLPVEEAVRIAGAVAQALDHAHRHGVLHRDLKPENVLLHETVPLVADFGLALALSEAASMRITATGVSLGTPQYMSPEQLQGRRGEVSARSDVYALGCLTYEMLTGTTPFAAPTAQATFARIMNDRPTNLRMLAAEVPAHVEAAVMRALEREPSARQATAGEFAAALASGPVEQGAVENVVSGGSLAPHPDAERLARAVRVWQGVAIGASVVALVALWTALR